MFSFKSFATVAVACGMGLAYGITPNKLVSGGIPAHTGSTTTDYLTDGYLTNWKSSSAKEIALKVGEGPKKLLTINCRRALTFIAISANIRNSSEAMAFTRILMAVARRCITCGQMLWLRCMRLAILLNRANQQKNCAMVL